MEQTIHAEAIEPVIVPVDEKAPLEIFVLEHEDEETEEELPF